MRTFFHMALIGWLVLGLCVPAAAQVYYQLDQCGSLQASDGLRIYFDEGATCECGGIINDPIIGCQSLGNMVQAYLVLTNPSAGELTRWQGDLRMEGDYSMQSFVHFGGPDITAHMDGNTHSMDSGHHCP